jgi:hypothetical protein
LHDQPLIVSHLNRVQQQQQHQQQQRIHPLLVLLLPSDEPADEEG